jgi:hypothetical protein
MKGCTQQSIWLAQSMGAIYFDSKEDESKKRFLFCGCGFGLSNYKANVLLFNWHPWCDSIQCSWVRNFLIESGYVVIFSLCDGLSYIRVTGNDCDIFCSGNKCQEELVFEAAIQVPFVKAHEFLYYNKYQNPGWSFTLPPDKKESGIWKRTKGEVYKEFKRVLQKGEKRIV